MVEGLWIELSSDVLKDLLTKKYKYHIEKASWYRTQADRLSEEIAESVVSNNPTQSLRASQKQHENKAGFFKTLADYVIPNEIYRLSEQNCIRIELYEQYF